MFTWNVTGLSLSCDLQTVTVTSIKDPNLISILESHGAATKNIINSLSLILTKKYKFAVLNSLCHELNENFKF